MQWQSLVSTIVIALLGSAVLTTILNNAFQSRREEKGRQREARGMLQRVRNSAAMTLEAAKAASYKPEIRIRKSTEALRDMMLSAEFTTAIADLDLDQAYRELEVMQIEARRLDDKSEQLARLNGDPREALKKLALLC